MSASVDQDPGAAAPAAIDDVITTLANDSINDNAVGDKAASHDAVFASATEGRRLYIGNLAYATTEGELKEFFKGYLVESVSIPKNPRTDRPVGYAFVDLSTPTEAERAIAELSGKDILERKVSVQLARKPETNGDKADGTNGEAGGEHPPKRRQHPRGRGRSGRTRGGRARGRGQNNNAENGHKDAGAMGEDAGADGEFLPLKDITNDKGPEKVKNTKPRAPRDRRERGPPADGIPSKNKVMVANLPYDLTEEKLQELFAAYQPLSAKIALRPIPRFMIKKLQARGEPRKGRGFGFVTLASEELQQKAVAEMNSKEIDGREIAVKVAIDSPDKTDDDTHANENEVAPSANGVEESPAAAAAAA